MKKKAQEKNQFTAAKLNFSTSYPDNHRTVYRTCVFVLVITVDIIYTVHFNCRYMYTYVYNK